MGIINMEFLSRGTTDIGAVFKMNDVSDKTKTHLTKVYGQLAACTALCAAGMYLNASILFIHGWVSGIFVAMGLMYATCQVLDVHQPEQARMNWLLAIAFFKGMVLGPAMHVIAAVEPELLVNAVVYTAIMFGSFSAISLFSKRRSYLFLGGVISTIVSSLFWFSLGTWLFGFRAIALDSLQYLLITLLVACLYVIYDTQLIIERAEAHNDRDVPKHTMMLFVDLLDLFIKILQILMELSDKKKKRRDDD